MDCLLAATRRLGKIENIALIYLTHLKINVWQQFDDAGSC